MKFLKKTAFLLCAGVLCGTVSGADTTADSARQNRSRENRRIPGGIDWAKIQKELKQKYPGEYANIEKLQSTDLFSAALALRQLAEKKGYKVGPERSGMRGRRGESGDRSGRMPMMMNPGRMGRDPRAAAEAVLKQKYPKEYAGIETLRQQTEEKLQQLAQKANIDLPPKPKSREEIMAELKQKFPAEYAEIESLRQSDPRSAFRKMRELMEKAGYRQEFGRGMPHGREPENGQPPPMRNSFGQLLRQLQARYPEEMRQINRLRREDPEKANRQLRELIQKMNQEKAAAEKTQK